MVVASLFLLAALMFSIEEDSTLLGLDFFFELEAGLAVNQGCSRICVINVLLRWE